MCVCVYISLCVYIYVCVYIYTYIYNQKKFRQNLRLAWVKCLQS